MFDGIYKNKKVLVTGHTGFKGSWLTAWLLQLGADIIGVSKDIPTNPSMFEVLGLDKKIKHSLEPINIGSNKPVRIRDLVKKIHKYSNSSSNLRIGDLEYRPNEIWNMQANNKFITSKGWKPKISFEQGLKNTINWYRNFYKLYLSKHGSFKKL